MSETAANSVTLRFLAAPTDIGHSGSVDAGTVLEWVDKAAYAAAVGWAKSYCVTAYVGNIHFADPVNSGDMVEVEATIVYTGRSSMHIRTVVSSGDPRGGTPTMRSQCMVIFVAVGDDGKPVPVAPFEAVTPAELALRDDALARIKVRDEIVAAMKAQEYTAAGTAERVVLRFMAAPTDVNWGGKVHGGIVMKWIDEAAYVCASRYCGMDTVAVFSGGVRFYRPLLIGHVVEVEARLVYTGMKGMHIAVHVRSGDPKGREMDLTTYCLTVMVARDDAGTSVPVPPWVPISSEDKALHAHARDLLEIRGRVPGNRLPNHLLPA
ncbi:MULTISPECIES: acyl-CoA thioesterase [unclassified Arthrobacter]|uniref:acyl-CoA thioesterase n=1 Tax=unclassified Arthrobacter TaxID=235627 RepID=UPI00159D918F|nr:MULTISPECIES: acyl-CoA thioesterase [unclassified Arthrobacter]MCQ9165196.1 acyl-CoA thioesterase [Arthrobacter sp. STN4]NVM98070.1 acyl-CoA thioesterase [Arthrobacter sp. SDTb3-6]